jgi:hypothetical protein
VTFSLNTLTIAEARATVIRSMLAELEDTIVGLAAMSDAQRNRVLDQDAEKITATVSRALTHARGQLAVLPVPDRLGASSSARSGD